MLGLSEYLRNKNIDTEIDDSLSQKFIISYTYIHTNLYPLSFQLLPWMVVEGLMTLSSLARDVTPCEDKDARIRDYTIGWKLISHLSLYFASIDISE
jgi:hypothetical protein